MKTQYRIISKFYNLIDVLYFNRRKYSPRQKILDFIKEGKVRVLDICTGTASNAILIADKKRNAEVVGIDLSRDMLRIAKERIRKRNIRNIKTRVMDATRMDFKDHSFDIVLISLILHEIDKNLVGKIINEAKRVLKPDGDIVIVEWEEPKHFFQRFMFGFIRLLEPKGFKEFIKLDLKEYFTVYGLKVKRMIHCDYSQVLKLGSGAYFL